jgi:alpha-beta hydrolase superfamily lysophospholipase
MKLPLVLVAAVLAVLALKLFVGWLEPRFAFYPLRGVDETPLDYGAEFRELVVETEDRERLVAWFLPQPDAAAEILYFHGNGGNLSLWAPILVDIHRQGFAVAALDYRGYGQSSGAPTERGLYRDVDAILERFWSELHRPGSIVVYWGRSLGAAPAAYASTRARPDALILEAAFSDARSVLSGDPILQLLGLFSTYRFPTLEFANRASGRSDSAGGSAAGEMPVLVLHGDADGVIPFEQGRRLYDGIRSGRKRFFQIRGGDHNDAAPRDGASYWRAVHDFIHHVQGGAP